MGIESKKEEAFPVSESRRPTNPGAEEWIGEKQHVLDHGFVYLVDYMGNDLSVEQAARVSYGGGTRKVTETEGLIRYLMRHRHTTPFEMATMKWHAKMPVFVARQWVRHRTASINEISGRYSVLPNEFYIPEASDLAVQSSSNRQGRGETLDSQQAEIVRKLIIDEAVHDYANYKYLLNDDGKGKPVDPDRDMLARELARMGLGLNVYTEWYWSANLHNTLHFLGLRKDKHAQKEIRVYADAMAAVVADSFPITWRAFTDYSLESAHFSGPELHATSTLLTNLGVTLTEEQLDIAAAASGLANRREVAEWKDKMRNMANIGL